MSADRLVFAFHGRPTTFYTVNEDDGQHDLRLRLMGPAYDAAGNTGSIVIPAKAWTQGVASPAVLLWVPACAGMTHVFLPFGHTRPTPL